MHQCGGGEMLIQPVEFLIWVIVWLVFIYSFILFLIRIIIKIAEYLIPLRIEEADKIIARDRSTCRLNDGEHRCKKASQHIRHIGSFFTPRFKQWVVVCPRHLKTQLSKAEVKRITEVL